MDRELLVRQINEATDQLGIKARLAQLNAYNQAVFTIVGAQVIVDDGFDPYDAEHRESSLWVEVFVQDPNLVFDAPSETFRPEHVPLISAELKEAGAFVNAINEARVHLLDRVHVIMNLDRKLTELLS